MRQLGWRRKKSLPVKTPTRSRFAAPSKPQLSCLFVHFSSVLLKRLKPSCCRFFFCLCVCVRACAGLRSIPGSLDLFRGSQRYRRWRGRGGRYIWNWIQAVQANLLYDQDWCGSGVWVSIEKKLLLCICERCKKRQILIILRIFYKNIDGNVWKVHLWKMQFKFVAAVVEMFPIFVLSREDKVCGERSTDACLKGVREPCELPWSKRCLCVNVRMNPDACSLCSCVWQWVPGCAGKVLCGRYPVDSTLLLPWGSVLELVSTSSLMSCFTNL